MTKSERDIKLNELVAALLCAYTNSPGVPLPPLDVTPATRAARDALFKFVEGVRLQALTEVHEHYEFDATTEEGFDTWLHERIKECRRSVNDS